MPDRTCNTTAATGEVAAPAAAPGPAQWRKSSYSNHESACVELARIDQETIAFRDSKDPDGPILAFDHREALAFIAAAGRSDCATQS